MLQSYHQAGATQWGFGRMKVIFLDIDGVLNCTQTPNPRKFPYIVDQTLLMRFHRLLESSGADVVLSSTWRYDPAGLFSAKHWGIPFIDVIPDMPHVPRCNEILEWLRNHPQVSRFAVIDDEDDELDDLPLFQPSSRTGLTDEIANGVRDYLQGVTDRDMRHGRMRRIIQNIYASLRQHRG
jgi:hypothetical protein